MKSSLNMRNSDDELDDDLDVLEDGPSDRKVLGVKRNNILEDSYARANTDNSLSVEDLETLGKILRFGFFKELIDESLVEDFKLEDNGMDIRLDFDNVNSKFPADEYMHLPKFIRGDANIVMTAIPSYSDIFLYELIQSNAKEFVDNDDAKVLANISILEFISFSIINSIWTFLAEDRVIVCDFTKLSLHFPNHIGSIMNFILLATQRRRIFSSSLSPLESFDNYYLFTDSNQSTSSLKRCMNSKKFSVKNLEFDEIIYDASNYLDCFIYNLNQLSRFNNSSDIIRDCKHSVKLLSKPGANKKQDISSANIMFNLFWRLLGATALLYSDEVNVDLNKASKRTLEEFYNVLPKNVKLQAHDAYTSAIILANVTDDFSKDADNLNLVSFKNSIIVFYNIIARNYDANFRVLTCPFLTKEESTYLIEKELNIDSGRKLVKNDEKVETNKLDDVIDDTEFNSPIEEKVEPLYKPSRSRKSEDRDIRRKPNSHRMMDELEDTAEAVSILSGLKSLGGRFGAAYHNRNHNGELDVKRKHAKRKAKNASKKAAKGIFKGTASGLKYAMKNPRGIFRLIIIVAGGFVIFNIALALVRLLGIL